MSYRGKPGSFHLNRDNEQVTAYGYSLLVCSYCQVVSRTLAEFRPEVEYWFVQPVASGTGPSSQWLASALWDESASGCCCNFTLIKAQRDFLYLMRTRRRGVAGVETALTRLKCKDSHFSSLSYQNGNYGSLRSVGRSLAAENVPVVIRDPTITTRQQTRSLDLDERSCRRGTRPPRLLGG